MAKIFETGNASDCFEISRKSAPLVQPIMQIVQLQETRSLEADLLKKLGKETSQFEKFVTDLKQKQAEKLILEKN